METATFSFPTTIRFGAGILGQLPEHLATLAADNPLVVTDPGLLKTAAFSALERVLGGRCAIFSGVHPNPVEEDVEGAARAYGEGGCDSVIAFGGGSALDVGKAVRLRVRRPEARLSDFDYHADWGGLAPLIAIPTTAGTGSEVGRSSVIVIGGRKRVIFHPALLAALVILDPELTRDLPAKLTAATGADALTHCIEAFTSTVFHPVCDGIALEGIRLIGQSLVSAVRDGRDLEARGNMQLAAAMGGIAFQKDLGAVHSLAHPLSSICGLHHGLANALCLPAVMEFNAQRKPGLYSRVGIALGLHHSCSHRTDRSDPTDRSDVLPPGGDAAVIAAVREILETIGLSGGLRSEGVNESHLDALVAQAMEDSCHLTNPVPVDAAQMRALYQSAF